MSGGQDDWVVVYRGHAMSALDLVEAMLAAEGLEPRRLGRASPALLGAGEMAIEQLIEVRAENVEAARALVVASESASSDPHAIEELEAEALRAELPREPERAASTGPSVWSMALIAVALVLAYLWLRG